MNTNWIVLGLASAFVAFGLYLLAHAWRMSREIDFAWYAAERQRRVTAARNQSYQAGALLIVGAALLVWMLFNPPQRPAAEPEPPLPTATHPLATGTPTLSATATAPFTPTFAAEPTETPVPPAPVAPLETPLVVIPTPDLRSQAVVTNTGGGGLWLRDAPFGDGLVLLPEGTTVFVPGGLMEVDGLMWQGVIDAEGREGWVAADYLIYR